jgi:hypothetical protein
VFKNLKKFLTFRWFYLYLAGCLALFEVFVLVASLLPSAVILAPWSLCFVCLLFPYCRSRVTALSLDCAFYL